MQKHITQCHVMTPWYAWGMFFLPDDKFPRAFVETYYGELDFELKKPSP